MLILLIIKQEYIWISHSKIRGCANFCIQLLQNNDEMQLPTYPFHWIMWINRVIIKALKHLTLFYQLGSVTSSSCGFGCESRSVWDGTLCGLRPQVIMSPLLFRQAVRINTPLFMHAACMHSATFQRMKGCYYGCLKPGLGSGAAKDELLKMQLCIHMEKFS